MFCCYPCDLWKHYLFISQIEAYKKKCDDKSHAEETGAGIQLSMGSDPEREPACWINGQPVYENSSEEEVTAMRG